MKPVTTTAFPSGVQIRMSFSPSPSHLALTVLMKWPSGVKTSQVIRMPSGWCIRLTFSAAGASKLCEASVYGYVEYPEE